MEYIPINFAELDSSQQERMNELFDKLEEREFVTRIFDNIHVD